MFIVFIDIKKIPSCLTVIMKIVDDCIKARKNL